MNMSYKIFLCIRGVKPEPFPPKAGLPRYDKAGINGAPLGISHTETSGFGSTTPIRLTSFAQGCPERSRGTLTIPSNHPEHGRRISPRSCGRLHFLILNISLLVGIFPLAVFPEDLCQYLSQQGGLNSNKPIAAGDYIYQRSIIFQAQTRSKPVSIEISYTYQSIDSDSITIKYQRIEKKKWGEDFVSFREPVEDIIDLPFNKDKQATLRIKEEPLGNYVVQNNMGGVVEGLCSNEPGINVLLSIDNDKRLTVKNQ
ncbi:MAG: hypothetical protein Q8O30_06380 [Candidatus Omnitrophota bacterium]|nr:hypothetical protein [Candidatus Omnitrophota bacterium]